MENPRAVASPAPATNALSRRGFLELATAGMAAVLTGCSSGSLSAPTADNVSPPIKPATTIIQEKPLPTESKVADTGYAPPPNFKAQPYIPPAPSAYIPTTGPDGVIPRGAWTIAGPAKPYQPMAGINLLTFHHDGDPTPFAQVDYWETARYLERIREYHARTGFQDIGYHFAIDRAGRVWQLRPLAYRGEHVRADYDQNHVYHKWNDHNIGVVVLGNFMLQSPTDAQKQKICSFGASLRKEYKLSIAQVKVHQELVSTECPGVHLRPYLDQVRQKKLI